jgi:choline dehydrogenase-like flavoprotein
MDHPTVNTGTLHLSKPRFPMYLYGHSEQKGTVVRGLLHLSESMQKERQTLNWAASLDPGEKSGYASLISFYRKLVKGRLSEAITKHFPGVMTDFADVVTGLRRRLTGQSHYSPKTRLIYAKVEQAPNPESRVTLSSERDRLGLKKAKLNWRLTTREKRTLHVANRVLDRQARQGGIGYVEPFEWLTSDDAAWPSTLEAYGHHMGTTRMSESPTKGVVDPDCRIHGIDNLFVAGSSVFPTGGCVNPTLTIVALALRLAEHVADQLRK